MRRDSELLRPESTNPCPRESVCPGPEELDARGSEFPVPKVGQTHLLGKEQDTGWRAFC